MTQSQSMRWLQIACLITIITGLLCAMASHAATDVVWRTLFDLLKWPLDGDPATFNADTRAVNAVLGGTMVGWGVLMYLIATPQQFAAIPALPTGSVAAGLPGNLVLNLVFLGLFVPPLRALARTERVQS